MSTGVNPFENIPKGKKPERPRPKAFTEWWTKDATAAQCETRTVAPITAAQPNAVLCKPVNRSKWWEDESRSRTSSAVPNGTSLLQTLDPFFNCDNLLPPALSAGDTVIPPWIYLNADYFKMVDDRVRVHCNANLSGLGVAGLVKLLVGSTALEDFMKLRAIYIWITENIEWDVEGMLDKDKPVFVDPPSVMKNKKTTSEGYANLFLNMAQVAGLKCDRVSGWVKGHSYQPGKELDSDNTYHFWNVVYYKEQVFFVDCCWGAGKLGKNEKFEKRFQPFWFYTRPQLMVFTHFPIEGENQHLSTAVTFDEFMKLPRILTPTFCNHQVVLQSPLTHSLNFGSKCKEIKVKIAVPDNVDVNACVQYEPSEHDGKLKECGALINILKLYPISKEFVRDRKSPFWKEIEIVTRPPPVAWGEGKLVISSKLSHETGFQSAVEFAILNPSLLKSTIEEFCYPVSFNVRLLNGVSISSPQVYTLSRAQDQTFSVRVHPEIALKKWEVTELPDLTFKLFSLANKRKNCIELAHREKTNEWFYNGKLDVRGRWCLDASTKQQKEVFYSIAEFEIV